MLGSATRLLNLPCADRSSKEMAQHAQRDSDERLNQLSDQNAFWGPLLAFRPEKNRCISQLRAMTMACAFGGFYGMLLNFGLSFLCRATGHHAPSLYGVPLVLSFTYLVGFQFTLGPAWNRRARLLARREGFMHSIGRSS